MWGKAGREEAKKVEYKSIFDIWLYLPYFLKHVSIHGSYAISGHPILASSKKKTV
jgi:hypothetical protein